MEASAKSTTPPTVLLGKSDRIWLAGKAYVVRLRTGWTYFLSQEDGRGPRLVMPHPVLAEHIVTGLATIEHRP